MSRSAMGLTSSVHTVHQRKQRCHERRVNLILLGATYRGQSVDFIEKYDRGLCIFGFLEEQSQLTFRFAYPFAETIGSLAHEEG